LERAGLCARTDLSLGWSYRGWGCGWRGRSGTFGFSPGLGRSAGCGRAAGHGGLASCLQAILAALPAAADFLFLLSHRGPPCWAVLRFLVVSEGPTIVWRGAAVNDSARRVWFRRPARRDISATREHYDAQRVGGRPYHQSLYVELSAFFPGRDLSGLPALVLLTSSIPDTTPARSTTSFSFQSAFPVMGSGYRRRR
jgi:hypothetical protein